MNGRGRLESDGFGDGINGSVWLKVWLGTVRCGLYEWTMTIDAGGVLLLLEKIKKMLTKAQAKSEIKKVKVKVKVAKANDTDVNLLS
jgi:hypothetical protein